MIALILGWLVDHRRMDDRIAKLEVQNQIYERQFADLQTRLDTQLMGLQMIYTWANATEFIQALTSVEDRDRFLEMAPSLAKADSTVLDESVQQLLGLIDSPEEEIRIRAVITLRFLQELGNDRMQRHAEAAANKLAALLEDSSTDVVGETLYALKSFGSASSPALGNLNHKMMNDEEWYAPGAALAVHAIDPSVDIGPRLIELITSEHPNWYTAAFHLPKHVPAERARQVLTALFERMKSEGDRNAVIQALNQIEP